SGSTGEPKGVIITLACLEHFTSWMLAEQQFSKHAEVFLNQAPFSFDLSVMDLYCSVTTGGRLFSIRRDLIENPKNFTAHWQLPGSPHGFQRRHLRKCVSPKTSSPRRCCRACGDFYSAVKHSHPKPQLNCSRGFHKRKFGTCMVLPRQLSPRPPFILVLLSWKNIHRCQWVA